MTELFFAVIRLIVRSTKFATKLALMFLTY